MVESNLHGFIDCFPVVCYRQRHTQSIIFKGLTNFTQSQVDAAVKLPAFLHHLEYWLFNPAL